MKKLLIAFLTLLLLTGCKNNYSTTKTEFTKEELYEKFYNTNYKLAMTYLYENGYACDYKVTTDEIIPENNIISIELKNKKVFLTVSKGPKKLYIYSYLGSARGLVEQWVEDLDKNYSLFDYEFIFNDGCQENYNCIVSEQSIVDKTIEKPTVIKYTFSLPSNK